MLNYLLSFIFGIRAKGEPIGQPHFRSVFPKEQPSEDEWKEMFNVSKAYYQNQNLSK